MENDVFVQRKITTIITWLHRNGRPEVLAEYKEYVFIPKNTLIYFQDEFFFVHEYRFNLVKDTFFIVLKTKEIDNGN